MAADSTAPKQRGIPFVKGKSGNPTGRPKGAKGKFAEAFWGDFYLAWEANGVAALAEVAANDPGMFVRVAASIMPKETAVTLRTVTAKELADDELANIATGSGEGTDSPSLDPAQLN